MLFWWMVSETTWYSGAARLTKDTISLWRTSRGCIPHTVAFRQPCRGVMASRTINGWAVFFFWSRCCGVVAAASMSSRVSVRQLQGASLKHRPLVLIVFSICLDDPVVATKGSLAQRAWSIWVHLQLSKQQTEGDWSERLERAVLLQRSGEECESGRLVQSARRGDVKSVHSGGGSDVLGKQLSSLRFVLQHCTLGCGVCSPVRATRCQV